VWHEELPEGRALQLLEKYVASGGQLLLLPPESPGDRTAFGMRWKSWMAVSPSEASDSASSSDGNDGPSLARVAQWQNDSQLLSNTLNGSPLPLGQLGIRRVCTMEGSMTPLASLPDNHPILAKIDTWSPESGAKDGNAVASEPTSDNADAAPAASNEGMKLGDVNVLDQSASPPTVVVCATTPSDRDSTLAGDGVVLYVTIQRLLAAGAQRVGSARNAIAGSEQRLVGPASSLAAGSETAPSSEYGMHAGVYQGDGLLVAMHRSPQEDELRAVDDEELGKLFGALPWAKIGAGKTATSLVQEIWRWFVVVMLLALLLEALLCLPRVQRRASTAVRGNPLQPSA
jgi:hypothetical protein